ncbi:glycosyltransferase family 4 protein [archaeon]|jgi:glycosyltransferase involved in cell wall biosynthesis|nr:glycosyltransferase family 4 protein [archaeon]MBT4396859.1 glycosyltransferase family 4 protein [archaeon]MBT4441463.1 glycosyltransferase family 4 protein [archaeon]
MRIAIVSMFYLPTIGGVEKVIEVLAKQYIKQGHKVDVFCCDCDKYKRIKKKFEIIDGVRVYRSRYWLRLSFNTHIFPGVIWDLITKKYDIIHSHVGAHDYVLFAGIIAKLKGVPHIHTTHCPWTDKFRPWPARFALFFTDNFFNYISFPLCDRIIAITPWEIPVLKKYVKEKKIKVLHNGMAKSLFKKVKDNPTKKSFMQDPKRKLVLFYGRLHPTKSPHHFAEVAVDIAKERKDMEFAIVGPDEGLMDRVKGIVKDHPRIHVLGKWIYEKNPELYQAADVYVLPSYREGLPLTIFEAMASGLPIVTTPVNGIPYEVTSGINGFLFKHGDRKKMKEYILRILDDPKLAKMFSENNKKKVKGYTWDQIAEETLDIYKEEILKK